MSLPTELTFILGTGHLRGTWWTGEVAEERQANRLQMTAIGKANGMVSGLVQVTMAKFGRRYLMHSDAGPAIITDQGTKIWVRQGSISRDGDQPAIEGPNGVGWYRNGRLHRESGPAFIGASQRFTWGLEGGVFDNEMDPILACLAEGGRVLEKVAVHFNGAYQCDVTDLEGRVFVSGRVASPGWFHWILGNRDRYFPELAAAMRAQAMRAVISSATATTQAPRPASRAKPTI